MYAWRWGRIGLLAFFGRMGGMVPLPEEIVYEAQHLSRVVQSRNGFGRAPARHNGDVPVRSLQTL